MRELLLLLRLHLLLSFRRLLHELLVVCCALLDGGSVLLDLLVSLSELDWLGLLLGGDGGRSNRGHRSRHGCDLGDSDRLRSRRRRLGNLSETVSWHLLLLEHVMFEVIKIFNLLVLRVEWRLRLHDWCGLWLLLRLGHLLDLGAGVGRLGCFDRLGLDRLLNGLRGRRGR